MFDCLCTVIISIYYSILIHHHRIKEAYTSEISLCHFQCFLDESEVTINHYYSTNKANMAFVKVAISNLSCKSSKILGSEKKMTVIYTWSRTFTTCWINFLQWSCQGLRSLNFSSINYQSLRIVWRWFENFGINVNIVAKWYQLISQKRPIERQ